MIEIGKLYKLYISDSGCAFRWREDHVEKSQPLDYITKRSGDPLYLPLQLKKEFSRMTFLAKLTMCENLKFRGFCEEYTATFLLDEEIGSGAILFRDAFFNDRVSVPFTLLRQSHWK